MLSDPKGHMSFHVYGHMIVNRDIQFPGSDIVDGTVVFHKRSPALLFHKHNISVIFKVFLHRRSGHDLVSRLWLYTEQIPAFRFYKAGDQDLSVFLKRDQAVIK